MKHDYILIALVLIFILTGISHAEIFRLKNGTVLQGSITNTTNDHLTIVNAADNKTITLKRTEITYTVKETVFDKKPDLRQLGKLTDEDWKKLQDKSLALDAPKTEPLKGKSPSETYRPRFGLFAGYMMPNGQIASALDPGLIYGLLIDLHMPVDFLEKHDKDWRAGISGSYAKLSSSGDASPADLTMTSGFLRNEIGFITKSGLRPYLKFDFGLTRTSMKDKSGSTLNNDKSSMDMTLLAGLGAGYCNPKLPVLEFFIDSGYMRVFEKVSANFLVFSFGVSCHFSAKKEDKDETK